MKAAIIRIRGDDGKIYDIPALIGPPGADGITPHIGEDGNWFIGDTDTGISAKGIPGERGQDGINGTNGADGKSAYQLAVDAGYAGTETEFSDNLKMLAELDIYSGETGNSDYAEEYNGETSEIV